MVKEVGVSLSFEMDWAKALDMDADEIRQVSFKAVQAGASVLENALIQEITNDSVLSERAKQKLLTTIRPYIWGKAQVISGEVGWDFHNSEQIDDGRIAQFLNFGTEERTTSIENGWNERGKIESAKFINRAIKKNAQKIRDAEKKVFDDWAKTRPQPLLPWGDALQW